MKTQKKSKAIKYFVIGTFMSLYILTSVVSTVHVIDFFELSNPKWMAVTLAVGFELGAAASLASLITLDKMNKPLIWTLFIVITLMQMQGNMYHAYSNIENYSMWSELFNLVDWEPLAQKRLLAAVSGAILPLVALGFIKSLVDYIRPEDEAIRPEDLDVIYEEINHPTETLDEQVESMRKVVDSYDDLTNEIEKKEQRENIVQMMQEDERDGIYDDSFEVDVISTQENEPELKTVVIENQPKIEEPLFKNNTNLNPPVEDKKPAIGAFGEVMVTSDLVKKVNEPHLPKENK